MLTAHERVACSMIDAAELAYSRKDKSLGLLRELPAAVYIGRFRGRS